MPVDKVSGNEVVALPGTELSVTATGTAGAGVTLTVPAAAGARHYITSIVLQRFATALLTAAATPVVVTTTNLPGSLAFSVPADAAAQGTVHEQKKEPAEPMISSAVNTDTTIVAPATTATIWRITVTYRLGR